MSESKFQEIFKTLDIKFKKTQLDLCTQCEILKEKIKNTENMEEKAEIALQLKNHHDAADFAYDCKKRDKELSRQDKSVKMFSFDLQQCLPTPYLKASMFFYKRPLWTFNLTIHDGATNKANCYIWHEAIAKRGANDIGSCIYKCLASLSNDVKHVILYSDSCTGQNRNSYICAMFAKVLEDHPTIETIDHKFLVVGHTYLECDTVHAEIEKKKKYTSVSIQHPHDWSNLIAATNKKYITQEMKQEEFYNFNALMKDKYTWRNNNTEDKYRLLASMSFMIVVIIVGVPMWWKTTEVYRVGLPSADIMSLSDDPIEIATKIAIFSFENARGELLVKELSEAYADNDLWRPQFIQIRSFEKASNTKTPAVLGSLLLKQEEIRAGDFIFIEWPKLQEEVLLTSDRSAFIRNDTSASRIKNVINLLILQTHRIQQILSDDHRHAVKTEAPQAEYDVVVSILNPRPDIMTAKWNARMAVETYIAPFLKEVSQISNYTLTTQWKYQLPFEADLKQVRDSSKLGRHYALGEPDLPHIITSIEKNLGVGITAKPAINLVVYITPCDIAPVHIYNRHNKQATRQKVDSFISPKWGGIIIANPPVEACLSYNTAEQPVEFYVNTNDVMQIMLYQLQTLLDINVEFTIDGVKTVVLEQIAPRRWEYEAYIRRSAVMHITTASNTLQSLIKLLDNISYIVINDDVSESINNAYKGLLLAKQSLAKGDLLAASDYARGSFIASEHAFFDASLLAQLYFPDEQKYAIYIPLFLPIMVPVITSFTMIRKLLTKLRNTKKEKFA